jgi:hypothetical protein
MELGEDLQLHGFVTQAAAFTDQYRFGGASDHGGGYDLRELGVNLSLRPSSDWLLSAQALSRRVGEMDDGSPRLDYAFVQRSLHNNGDHRLSVELGKVKNPYGFYNLTRDVAHTRPGVTMPAVYPERIRDFFLSAPGVSLRGEHDLGRVDLRWMANLVEMEGNSEEMEYFFTMFPQPGHFDGQRSWLGQVIAEVDGGRWRLGLSLGDLAMKYRSTFSSPLEPGAGETRLKPVLFSLQHNLELLSLTAEYTRVLVDNSAYNLPSPAPQIFDYHHQAEGWYLQATWRCSPRWQTWLRHEESYFNRKDKDGSQFEAQLTSELPFGMVPTGVGAMTYAKAWVLGVRHDFNQNLMISAEWHTTQGLVDLSPRDNPAGFTRGKNWDLLLLQLGWRF